MQLSDFGVLFEQFSEIKQTAVCKAYFKASKTPGEDIQLLQDICGENTLRAADFTSKNYYPPTVLIWLFVRSFCFPSSRGFRLRLIKSYLQLFRGLLRQLSKNGLDFVFKKWQERCHTCIELRLVLCTTQKKNRCPFSWISPRIYWSNDAITTGFIITYGLDCNSWFFNFLSPD